ncbi:MAG: fumarate reductase subunit C [Cryomorphaceae bacterium]|jgi:fumarate reductase subunit C
MNNQYLSDFQLDQVRVVLRKYGIESDDLCDELTDHYAGILEERIEKGASFDEAFQTFVSENSWLKLRKLQHAHWKYADKSIKRYVISLLREIWLTPKVVIAVGLIIGLIALLRLPVEQTLWIFNVVHSALIVLTLYIGVTSIVLLRSDKTHDLTISCEHEYVDVLRRIYVLLDFGRCSVLPNIQWRIFLFPPIDILRHSGTFELCAFSPLYESKSTNV